MTTPAPFTGVSVSIGPQYNTITPPRRWETRVIVVTWRTNGQYYRREIPYKVVPFLNHSVTFEQVRAYLGYGEDELEDAAIDLSQAYYRVEDAIGATLLSTSLASGTIAEMDADKAILCSAVILLLPSLRLRTLQSQQNGDVKANRFSTAPDFDKIQADVESQLALAIANLQGTKGVNPTLLTLSQPHNPFPGRYIPTPYGAGGGFRSPYRRW